MISAENLQKTFFHPTNLSENEQIFIRKVDHEHLDVENLWALIFSYTPTISTQILTYMSAIKQRTSHGVSPNDNQFEDLSGIPLSSAKNPFDTILKACENNLVSLHRPIM